MTTLRSWFDGRSKREQRLLLVMTALAAITIVWGLVIRPMSDMMAGARERHAAAVVRFGETAARVDALRDARAARVPLLTGSLADAVRARADQAGLPIASLDPDGNDGVQISIQSAKGSALTAWLARLERAGIVVESAALTDNGDRTVAGRLVLRRRAA
ncbi:general secretion pathway protein GspM [Sphingomonas sp. Leaf339]|uniref:type II secretion system protein M n=1 Tax=Sphingomonas sp. Leaf339 TaxID=1736343 RepID=UPI0007014597|nr:type II secretion system protein M [Sphingomonas sp. Leaf339]KQU62271.1 general secretion pathway protein GspM [Sphingomonas sp. Leaf339]